MIKLFPWNLWFIPLMNSLLYTLLIKPLCFPVIEIRSSVMNWTYSWTLVYSIQVKPAPKVFLHTTAVSQFMRFDSLGHGSAISSWVSNGSLIFSVCSDRNERAERQSRKGFARVSFQSIAQSLPFKNLLRTLRLLSAKRLRVWSAINHILFL